MKPVSAQPRVKAGRAFRRGGELPKRTKLFASAILFFLIALWAPASAIGDVLKVVEI